MADLRALFSSLKTPLTMPAKDLYLEDQLETPSREVNECFGCLSGGSLATSYSL